MGVASSCPSGFEQGFGGTCRVLCPSDFKYTMAGFWGRCVYRQDNSVYFDLRPVQGLRAGMRETPAYAQERARVEADALSARTKVSTNNVNRSQFGLANANRTGQMADYSRIQNEYAGYATSGGVLRTIKQVNNSLKPFRPPTSPASDIEIERKAILSISNRHLLIAQVALFVAVIVLLVYALIPGTVAHTVAFVVLVCGIASGFFLRT